MPSAESACSRGEAVTAVLTTCRSVVVACSQALASPPLLWSWSAATSRSSLGSHSAPLRSSGMVCTQASTGQSVLPTTSEMSASSGDVASSRAHLLAPPTNTVARLNR